MKAAAPHLRAAACAIAIFALGAGARAASVRLHAPAPSAPLVAGPAAAAGAAAVADVGSPVEDPQDAAELGAELRIAVARAALATGDAPGADSANVPRPARSTRLLDTTLDRTGSRLRLYSTEEGFDAVRTEVLRGIVANGFTRAAVSDDPRTASYRRGNDFVVVRFSQSDHRELGSRDSRDQREPRTIVSVVELGFRTTASPTPGQ